MDCIFKKGDEEFRGHKQSWTVSMVSELASDGTILGLCEP